MFRIDNLILIYNNLSITILFSFLLPLKHYLLSYCLLFQLMLQLTFTTTFTFISITLNVCCCMICIVLYIPICIFVSTYCICIMSSIDVIMWKEMCVAFSCLFFVYANCTYSCISTLCIIQYIHFTF